MTAAHGPVDLDGPPVRSVRGRVGMACLILTETALFLTFVVTFLFYIRGSLTGPYAADVLELPLVLINTVCLFASSGTIVLAVKSLERGNIGRFRFWWILTFLLGLEFLVGTIFEWKTLIEVHRLTLASNLFGTTFYSLVGLHLAHVTMGLIVMFLVATLAIGGHVRRAHAERMEILSWYWHFVDAVWVVVLTTVYFIGTDFSLPLLG